jgi:hypothetical protein
VIVRVDSLPRPWRALALVVLLSAMLVPGLAIAAGDPPLPRPRPDHDVQPGPPPAQAGQGTDQGDPGGDNSDVLMAPGDNAKLGTTPQPVTLIAEVTEKSPKINDGLVWRIFDTKPDQTGQFPMVAKSQQASPTLRLKPGDYVVHVAYGRAQMSDTLSVRNGATKKEMILDAGGLKLNAMITGDLPIPFNLLHFDVFTAGTSDADRTLVAEKISAGDILTLNAGTYHIVSHFGSVNAVVRADLRVEPGQLTEATLYQKAAEISFKLVSDTGGEAIADVDWTVKNKDGATVFTNTGTFPATVLEEGEYSVSAKRGDKLYNQQFKVTAGKTAEIEVRTSAN